MDFVLKDASLRIKHFMDFQFPFDKICFVKAYQLPFGKHFSMVELEIHPTGTEERLSKLRDPLKFR